MENATVIMAAGLFVLSVASGMLGPGVAFVRYALGGDGGEF